MSDYAKLFEPGTPNRSYSTTETKVAKIVTLVRDLAEEASSQSRVDTECPRFLRRAIAVRAARQKFFSAGLFADPAWDMLLELFLSEREQRRISISGLCLASGVPATTALRWIEKLCSEGLTERIDDPLDRRRIWIQLTRPGFEAMSAYLQDIGRHDSIIL